MATDGYTLGTQMILYSRQKNEGLNNMGSEEEILVGENNQGN